VWRAALRAARPDPLLVLAFSHLRAQIFAHPDGAGCCGHGFDFSRKWLHLRLLLLLLLLLRLLLR